MSRTRLLLLLASLLLLTLCLTLYRGGGRAVGGGAVRESPVVRWASLSLCWGEKAQVFGKQAFPYSEAAGMSARLWRNQTLGKVGVILTIVTDLEVGQDTALDLFVREVEDNPGVVVVLQRNLLGDCVLQSQVTRMFAWDYSVVTDSDIIILSDADLFVVGRALTEMLELEHRVWIGEYSHTDSTGGTIPMSLVGMSSMDWRESLDFSSRQGGGPKGMKEVVEHFKELNGDVNWGKWEVDQVILSHAILRPDRQLCSLGRENTLWQRLKYTPREFNDTGVCFHGDLMNCHRGHPWPSCAWWHFFPHDQLDYLIEVFTDIMTSGSVGNSTTMVVPRVWIPVIV